jgi:hypothetical protein
MAEKISASYINKIRLVNQSGSPSSPAAGYQYIYVTTDGLYIENENGVNLLLGSTILKVAQVTSNYNVSSTDRVILSDATSGSLSINLPTIASSYNTSGSRGTLLDIKKIDSSSNKVRVTPNGTETIDFQTTQDLTNQGDAITIISGSAGWFII